MYHRDARGLAFPVCRGSDPVNFASLVEVVAAHTAENDLSQVCLCIVEERIVCMHACMHACRST